MRSFLNNELEAISYLIYALAVLMQLLHNKLSGYKVLCVYYIITALLLYIGIAFFASNNWTYNLIFFANMLILSRYFYKLFDTTIKKKITIACCLFNSIIFIYTNIFLYEYNEYNSIVYGISFITIVLYSLLHLHQLMISLKEENLLLDFDFWLTCVYLLYFLGSFIIILYYNNSSNKRTRGDMWQLHNIILFICSAVTLFISLQIYKKRKLHHG